MERELSAEEINQVVRAARVLATGFTGEQLQSLINAQQELKQSGFCETAWGIVRLQREKGISCTEALDAFEQLLQDKAELEQKVAELNTELAAVEARVRQAEERFQQFREAIKQAEEELHIVQTKRQKEERELVAFKRKAEKEKASIDKEVDEYRQKANVSEAQIAATSELEAYLRNSGFSIELVLALSQEFVSHKNAREQLAKAIEEYGTLTSYNEQAKARKKELETDLKALEGKRGQLEGAVRQLQADVATENELRRFYKRYREAAPLLEYLASWKQLFFVRCNNPVFIVTGAFSRSAGPARFWMDKSPIRCPHCGCGPNLLLYDEKPYEALGLPVGSSVRLQLEE